MRAVDTNLLVRLATRDDPRQTAAAEAFVAGGAWIPQLAVSRRRTAGTTLVERQPPDRRAADLGLNQNQ